MMNANNSIATSMQAGINGQVPESSSLKALQHAEMREDTAIQRQVADLKAAGLNPILASNYSGASSAAAVKYVDSEATRSMANSAEKNANANLINAITRIFTSALKVR